MDKDKLEEEIEARLELYGAIFDEYYATGVLPGAWQGDVLAEYIKSVLDDPGVKYQGDHDAIWLASLRDAVLEFIRVLLPYYLQIEKQAQKEREYKDSFFEGDINLKRAMWSDMVEYIEETYSANEVNIGGYSQQLKQSEKDKEVIFDCLEEEWDNALDEREKRAKGNLVAKNKNRVEQAFSRLVGTEEYKKRSELGRYIHKYPELEEIVRIIGRERQTNTAEMDETTEKYIPLLMKHSLIRENIDGVTMGNNLSAMLPTEVALLADARSEQVFYKKYATKQLQLLSGKSPLVTKKKKETHRKSEPRLTEGPIIVALDTSGSMGGEREKVSKALLLQLLEMAKKKRRKCFLITFSISAMALEITHPKNWVRVSAFLSEHFTAGTDGNQMLSSALEVLEAEHFSMADVLIISDFEFDPPKAPIRKAIVEAQNQGTRFYGMRLTGFYYEAAYQEILDKIWEVNI